ncbi:hypothetical protein NMY22_g15453 [Coprinellus aureogranulatus]|nr:hypothetical protein NMY22_g15453 [Coprinellus aureogranulatus]
MKGNTPGWMSSNVFEVMNVLVSGKLTVSFGMQSSAQASSVTLDALEQLALDCHENEVNESIIVLQGLINAMEFTLTIQRHTLETKKKRSKIFDELVEKSSGKLDVYWLYRYHSLGSKACMLAGAGSFYFLVLIAVARLRTTLSLVSGSAVCEMAKAIRFPDGAFDSSIGSRVKTDLIPALALMRKHFPIMGDLAFRDTFLNTAGVRASSLDLTNLVHSDQYFENVIYNAPMKPRDCLTWAPLGDVIPDVWNRSVITALYEKARATGISPQDLLQLAYSQQHQESDRDPSTMPQRPSPDWDATVDLDNMVHVKTKFDPTAKKNTTLPFKRGSEEARNKATEEHRRYASKARASYNSEQCIEKILYQLRKGEKGQKGDYVYVDMAWFAGKVVKFTDKDGNIIAILFADMPEDLSSKALDTIRRIFPSLVKSVRSVDEKGGFYSFHFSYYNRYSKLGDGTPAEAEPSSIHRIGKNNVSTKLNIPRESKEGEEMYQYKQQLELALAPMLQWISKRLKELLPDTYEILSEAVEVLPLSDTVPAHPFTGFVINFNVVTRIHRDFQDKDICLVFQFNSKDLQGGELVLVEPGLVIRLMNGNGILFRSHKITHLNLDFVGERVSLVFHSDRAMDNWVETYNGWGHNSHFRLYHNVDFDPNEGEQVDELPQ